MAIRLAMKAVILREGHVLLNECEDQYRGHYYTFPGGGQELGETVQEAIVREVLEETGYHVVPGAFLAWYETIRDDEDMRRQHPHYFHISYHFIRCTLADGAMETPSHMDAGQLGNRWVPLAELQGMRVFPEAVRDALPALLAAGSPAYLGSVHIP